MKMHVDSGINKPEYQNHQVFELIDDMMEVYTGLSDTCMGFIPNGTSGVWNYATYVFMSNRSTLDSIKMLLKTGHITDAFVLIRKLLDTVLADVYLDALREDQFDWIENFIVKDFDEWIKGKHWIPKTEKIMSVLKESKSIKELYPFFGWDTYMKKNRAFLDNHVHASSYFSILLNCQDICLDNRELQLKNASVVLNQIMTLHLAFIFYMNGHYMMATNHVDCLDCGITPPEGSERWIAPYAQKAFDIYIKPHSKLAAFVKDSCCLDIE